MTPAARASFRFQAPDPVPYRQDLIAHKVCPHCKEATTAFIATCDGYAFDVDRCRHHGDVVAILSHIRNESYDQGEAHVCNCLVY